MHNEPVSDVTLPNLTLNQREMIEHLVLNRLRPSPYRIIKASTEVGTNDYLHLYSNKIDVDM
jgi:hypothetical protein